MISSRSSSERPGRREGHDVAHHLGGVGGVVDERLGADRDLVAEHGGDLVGVAGAADVAQQRHPVGGLADLLVEPRLLAHPRREQARPQLRLERLAEGVVLGQRQRGDELGEAKRRIQDRASSRCMAPRSGASILLTRGVAPLAHCGRRRASEGRRPWRIRRRSTPATPSGSGVIADQTGPLSFVGLANANVARMVIGDINARGGLLGRSSGAAPRGRRHRRRRRRGRGGEAGRGRSGRRRLRRHLQLHAAGHQGPGRHGGQDALHLPRAVRGAGVRPADLLHRPGAGAAGRPVHPVADARDRGEDVLPAVGRLHLAARA